MGIISVCRFQQITNGVVVSSLFSKDSGMKSQRHNNTINYQQQIGLRSMGFVPQRQISGVQERMTGTSGTNATSIIPSVCSSSLSHTGAVEGATLVDNADSISKRRSFGVTLACVMCAIAVTMMMMPEGALAASTDAVPVAQGSESSMVHMVKKAVSFVLHLDVHLGDIVSRFGVLTYGILFAIVFAETGLVVTPLLPGDSLLFATGALAGLGKLNIAVLLTLYMTAATLGDAVNYSIGKFLGKRAMESKLVKAEYVKKTESFYEKYGGKTIVLARFVPIVRTFAPFVAGVGSMAYQTFAFYNVFGAALWTVLCVGAGYVFGNIPAVQSNFSLVVLGIIFVSVLPILYEVGMSYITKGMQNNSIGRSGRVARRGPGGSMAASFTNP
uniref:VTT domain-containing protein n=1 Tax=Picochlorum oklahomense TaxID=249345 RepID=A0A7S1CVG1_9CHLO|mmetsp:Transcript_1761/g.3608  ORF Transcript_1761/g.3608 Transcript_1761/m.3608 type:complete len:386 (+) Transcript_1761:70-1227(+)